MKAVVHHRYGSPDQVLWVAEIPMPLAADSHVLVRVRAASVHPDIWHVVRGLQYALRLMGNGVRKPKYRHEISAAMRCLQEGRTPGRIVVTPWAR